MGLEEEIGAVENVGQVGRDAASEHMERAVNELHLGGAGREPYRDFLDVTIRNANAMLAHCRELAGESSTGTAVRGLLGSVRETVRLLYVAMTVVERTAGSDRGCGAAQATGLRSCSFCGKPEAETKLVAGPRGNICASRTQPARGVLGI